MALLGRRIPRTPSPAQMSPLESRVMMHALPGLEQSHGRLHKHLEGYPVVVSATIKVGPLAGPLPMNTSPVAIGDELPAAGAVASGTVGLDQVPVLHSNPSATKKLFLDFNGAPAMGWGSYQTTDTPAYDQDGDVTTFSASELANIQQIWARVAEKYSPFNVDVTTQDPGTYPRGQVVRAVVGGDGAWLGAAAGGVAYVNGFTSGSSAPNMNTVWIFPNNLGNGDPHYTAEGVSHESGHAFGLQHQSVYSGTTKTDEYNPGNSLVAPVMGNSYYSPRGLWWYGQNSVSSTTMQDDMLVISKSANGFGYRSDDHGDSPAAADPFAVSGSSVSGSGVIAKTTDADDFSFTTASGQVTFTADVASYGPTLDLKLRLIDSSGNVLKVVDGPTLGEILTATVASGTYTLEVSSHGSYGDVGQYSVIGTVVPPVQVNGLLANPGATFSLSGPAGAETLSVTGGAVALNADLSVDHPGLSLVASGGSSVTFNAPQHLAALTLSGGATAVASPAQAAMTVGALSIDSTSALDLADNDLLVDRNLTGAATVQSYLTTGYNSGTWKGPGLRSSSAAASPSTRTLGYADAPDVNPTTKPGLSVPAGQVLVRFTLPGDVNLDRRVNNSDVTILRANFGLVGTAAWDQGDSTYDARVNNSDLTVCKANFGQILSTSTAAATEVVT